MKVSSRPMLASFVSSHKYDVYRLHARDDPIAPGLPFACAFTAGKNPSIQILYKHYLFSSHTDAKRGGVPILAVATQDGTVELLNVGKRQELDIGSYASHRKMLNDLFLDRATAYNHTDP